MNANINYVQIDMYVGYIRLVGPNIVISKCPIKVLLRAYFANNYDIWN